MAANVIAYEKAQRQSSLNLFQSGHYSDLTFKCGKLDKPVHKFILCEASPVIAAEVKEKWTESSTGVIHHTVYDDTTAYYMLEYMYTGDYKLKKQGTIDVEVKQENNQDESDSADKLQSGHFCSAEREIATSNQELIAHIRVRALADYYDVKNLIVLAEDKFVSQVTDTATAAGFVAVIGALCELVKPGSRMFNAAVEATHDNMPRLCKDPSLEIELSSNADIQFFTAALVKVFSQHSRLNLDRAVRTSRDPIQRDRMLKEIRELANTCKLRCTMCDNRTYGNYPDMAERWLVDDRDGYGSNNIVCSICRLPLYKCQS